MDPSEIIPDSKICKAVLLSLSTFQAFSTEAEGAETILFPITAISLQCSKSPTKPSLNKLVFKDDISAMDCIGHQPWIA